VRTAPPTDLSAGYHRRALDYAAATMLDCGVDRGCFVMPAAS